MNYVFGLDVSHYQGDIDWSKIKEPIIINGQEKSVHFVYIKASEGEMTSDFMSKNHAIGAQQSGVRFGYYHFARPTNFTDIRGHAVNEAKHFLDKILTLPESNLPHVLDLEANKKLHPDQFQIWVQTWIDTVNSEVMIYGSPSFLSINLPSTHPFGKNKLWLAEYGVTENHLRHVNGWLDWTVWQYTDKFQHPAIKGFVDANFAHPDFILPSPTRISDSETEKIS